MPGPYTLRGGYGFAEAAMRGGLGAAWLAGASRELAWFVRHGGPNPRPDDPRTQAAIDDAMRAARAELATLRIRGPVDRRAAGAWLRAALTPDLVRLSALAAPPGGWSGHFWGLAVFHRLALGRYPKARWSPCPCPR